MTQLPEDGVEAARELAPHLLCALCSAALGGLPWGGVWSCLERQVCLEPSVGRGQGRAARPWSFRVLPAHKLTFMPFHRRGQGHQTRVERTHPEDPAVGTGRLWEAPAPRKPGGPHRGGVPGARWGGQQAGLCCEDPCVWAEPPQSHFSLDAAWQEDVGPWTRLT